MKVTIFDFAYEAGKRLKELGYNHKQILEINDEAELFDLARKLFDAGLNVMLYHDKCPTYSDVTLYVDTRRFCQR